MSCHRHKHNPLAKSESEEKLHMGVMANKDIWMIPISIVFSQSHQAGQMGALPGDFGTRSDFNYLETEQAIRANDKAWTQRIRTRLGSWCTQKRRSPPRVTARWSRTNATRRDSWGLVGSCGLSPRVIKIVATFSSSRSFWDIVLRRRQGYKVVGLFLDTRVLPPSVD